MSESDSATQQKIEYNQMSLRERVFSKIVLAAILIFVLLWAVWGLYLLGVLG